MRFWTFDPNTCRFERASKQAALHAADVAVVNDDTDVQVISDHQPPKRWPSGEPLVVAGVEFERELLRQADDAEFGCAVTSVIRHPIPAS